MIIASLVQDDDENVKFGPSGVMAVQKGELRYFKLVSNKFLEY